MTSYLVNPGPFPSTYHLARFLFRHFRQMMEDAILDRLKDKAADSLNEDDEDETVGMFHGMNHAQFVRWEHVLFKELQVSLNVKTSPTIEFPLVIEERDDIIVRVARLHDQYAVVGSHTDLEMTGLETLEGFRQVKDFTLPHPVCRRVLKIDIDHIPPKYGDDPTRTCE